MAIHCQHQAQQKAFSFPWENSQISPAARDQSILTAKSIFNGERVVLSHGSREMPRLGHHTAQKQLPTQSNEVFTLMGAKKDLKKKKKRQKVKGERNSISKSRGGERGTREEQAAFTAALCGFLLPSSSERSRGHRHRRRMSPRGPERQHRGGAGASGRAGAFRWLNPNEQHPACSSCKAPTSLYFNNNNNKL